MSIEVVQLPQQPQQTWGNDLAAVALNYGDQYARQQAADRQRQNQLADEATRRSQQLADTGSERQYESAQYDRRTKERTTEEQTRADRKQKARTAQGLIDHGYLDPADRNDDQAIAKAFSEAKADGLVDRYRALINGGYLKRTDIGNKDAVATAEQSYADDQKKQMDLQRGQGSNARQGATKLAREMAQTKSRLDQLIQRNSIPVDQLSAVDPQRDAQLIRKVSLQLAQQANPALKGDALNVAAQSEVQAAIDEIKQQRMQLVVQQRAQDKALEGQLRGEMTEQTASMRDYTSKGYFPDESAADAPQAMTDPAAVSPTAAAPGAAGAPPPAAGAPSFADALAAKLGTSAVKPPPMAPSVQPDPALSGGAMLPPNTAIPSNADPAARAILAQAQNTPAAPDPNADPKATPEQTQEYNARMASALAATNAQTKAHQLMKAKGQLAQITAQIQGIEDPANTGSATDKAGYLTNLLQAKAALENQINQLQPEAGAPTAAGSAMAPPQTGAPTAMPAFSNSNGSSPVLPPPPAPAAAGSTLGHDPDWWTAGT